MSRPLNRAVARTLLRLDEDGTPMYGVSVLPLLGDSVLHDALYAALRSALMVQRSIDEVDKLTRAQKQAVERVMRDAASAPADEAASVYAEVTAYFEAGGSALQISRTPAGRYSINQQVIGDTLVDALHKLRIRRETRRNQR